MSYLNGLEHTIRQYIYHVRWCPKYRFRILKGTVRKPVKEIGSKSCEQKRLEFLELNILEDHLHLPISIPPKFAASELISFLKGKCAINILDSHLEQKKRNSGRHFWAKGYCASTVGLKKEEIRKHIKLLSEKNKRMDRLKIGQ